VEADADPVCVFLGKLNWLSEQDSYRGLLEQVSSFRRVDEPEVEDYAIAAVGQAMLLRQVPFHIVTKVMSLLVKLPTDELDTTHVGIVNGAYLTTPLGIYTLPSLKKVERPDLVPLVTDVFSLGGFWVIAQRALCAPSA